MSSAVSILLGWWYIQRAKKLILQSFVVLGNVHSLSLTKKILRCLVESQNPPLVPCSSIISFSVSILVGSSGTESTEGESLQHEENFEVLYSMYALFHLNIRVRNEQNKNKKLIVHVVILLTFSGFDRTGYFGYGLN